MTPNKVQHFQEWLSLFKKSRPKSAVLQMVEALAEVANVCNKIGLNQKQTLEILNELVAPTKPILGTEAGEKLKGSIVKLQAAQQEPQVSLPQRLPR